jgi:hypothetical protein
MRRSGARGKRRETRGPEPTDRSGPLRKSAAAESSPGDLAKIQREAHCKQKERILLSGGLQVRLRSLQ